VNLRGWEVERVAGADREREPRRDHPVVADKELGNMRARLNHLFLDVDGERVHLSQQSEANAFPLPETVELFVPVVVKANDPVGLGGFRTSSASRRISVPNLNVWRPRTRVNVSRNSATEVVKLEFAAVVGPNLLESGDGEDGQHRCEGIGRQAGHRDSTVLKRGLIEIAPGIAKPKLVQSGRRGYPVVVAGEGVAAR